ncbi:42507_t:CDS:2, partial [Gigaspora margarita]
HNLRTCPELAKFNIAKLKPADNNEKISMNNSIESNIFEIEESGSDAEENNINKRKCGICGLEGHNT